MLPSWCSATRITKGPCSKSTLTLPPRARAAGDRVSHEPHIAILLGLELMVRHLTRLAYPHVLLHYSNLEHEVRLGSKLVSNPAFYRSVLISLVETLRHLGLGKDTEHSYSRFTGIEPYGKHQERCSAYPRSGRCRQSPQTWREDLKKTQIDALGGIEILEAQKECRMKAGTTSPIRQQHKFDAQAGINFTKMMGLLAEEVARCIISSSRLHSDPYPSLFARLICATPPFL
nr:hypothetical protein CFP56_69078 [Quercus suber]